MRIPSPKIYSALTLMALVALLAAPLGAADRFTHVAATADPDFPGFLHWFVVASTDDEGNETLLARYGYDTPAFGFDIGDRVGSDVAIDGTGIWGSSGTLVDVEISSIVKPESVLVLLDTLEIVELRGIWGSSGTLFPSEVIVHGPVWDVDACGEATAMVETVREVSEPTGVEPDPLLAVGTEGGCVGFVGYDTPAFGFDWYQSPEEWSDEPLVATGDPLIAIWGSSGTLLPVDDLTLLEVDDDWNVVPATWEAPTDNWVAPTADWTPDPQDWIPSPKDWNPNPKNWFEVGAVSGSEVRSVFPGRRAIGETPGFPPFSSFQMIGDIKGESIVSLGGKRFPVGIAPSITLDDPATVLVESPLAAAAGIDEVGVAEIGPGLFEWASTSALFLETTTLVSTDLSQVVLGSLVGLSTDGQSVLFLPEYDPASGDPGPEAVLGGVTEVDLGPRAFNLGANGNFVTASIEASGDDVGDIVQASLELAVEGDPGAALLPVQLTSGDDDGDGNQELVAKFDRDDLHQRLEPFGIGAEVVLTISWEYFDECDVGVPCTGGYSQTVTLVND